MNREITSAKLTKENTLVISYIESGDDLRNEIEIKCSDIAHEDLVNAFQALSGHICHICELPEVNDLTIEDIAGMGPIENVRVSKITKSGSGENVGFVLVAYRELASEKGMNVITPFMKVSEDLSAETVEAIGICEAEVEEYLNGKTAPRRQLEMDFEGNLDDDDLEIHDDGVKVAEKPKRGRKKKNADDTLDEG